MIRFAYIGIISGIVACSACKTTRDVESSNTPLFEVSGTVYVTSDYCGGAHPNETILQNLKTPKPYEGKKLFIRDTDSNDFSSPVVYSLTTDQDGRFTCSLPEGKYCIIDEYRVNRGYTDSLMANVVPDLKISDPWCIRSWSAQCLMTFEIKNKNMVLPQINIHQQCFRPDGIPCLIYTGPLPQ